MRLYVLSVLAASGCWLQEPTGAPQSWPPPLGVQVETVIGSDLNGDGVSEMVVYSSAAGHGGLFLIEGSASTASGATPSTFKAFTSLPLVDPTAGGVLAGTVYAAYPDPDGISVDLDRFDAKLTRTSHQELIQLGTAATLLWLSPFVRSDGKHATLVGNGTLTAYVPDVGDPVLLGTPTLSPPVLFATGYVASGQQMVLAADKTDAAFAELPATGVVAQWTSARSGTVWVGQTVADLDGDGVPELLGYDPVQHAVCVLGLVPTPDSTCTGTGDTSTLNAVTIYVADFLGSPALDIAVVFAGPATVDVAVLADVSWDGSFLLGTAMGAVAKSVPLAQAHAFVVERGPGLKTELELSARDGTLGCGLCN